MGAHSSKVLENCILPVERGAQQPGQHSLLKGRGLHEALPQLSQGKPKPREDPTSSNHLATAGTQQGLQLSHRDPPGAKANLPLGETHAQCTKHKRGFQTDPAQSPAMLFPGCLVLELPDPLGASVSSFLKQVIMGDYSCCDPPVHRQSCAHHIGPGDWLTHIVSLCYK